MSPVRAVWFDVGEVLINETREYGAWADWLGIPRLQTLKDAGYFVGIAGNQTTELADSWES
ncbi:MAG: hypothetical protein JO345_15400 [Streptosporangiaceae bacterium]|nr:hypothetical protein [Streptosporangiaceae bacterium]